MAFNLENMTIDYKKMLRMIPSDRTPLAQSGVISDLISSLTPGQLVNLFPRYYRDQLPDVGKSVGSLGGALSGGTNISGGGGDNTYTPNTIKPLKSPSAEETAIQELFQKANVGTVELSGDSREKAADLTDRMVKDLGISETKAAAIVGNFMHESGDFQHMQEIAPVSGRGGYGWAQWTGPRRRNFEAFVANKGLDINSDDANYQFFLHEIQNDPYEKQQFERWKNTEYVNLAAETVAFENSYERAGVKHHGSRIQRAETALQMYEQKIANIESDASNIQDLSTVQPQFDPNMVSQLDERLQKWYNNANDIQKKNFEEALGKLGVDQFNQTMERQPVNNVTLQAVTISSEESRVSEEQAGYRSSPLKPELKNALEFAAEKSGLYVKVFSGGQTEEQQAALAATGSDPSNRHDIQNPDTPGAADVRLAYRDADNNEVILDQSNPEHWPMIAEFVKNSSRTIPGAGVGGWLPNDNYMGKTSMHIGGPNKKGDAPLAYQGMEFFKQAHAEGVALREQDKKNDYDPLAEWTKKKQEENNKKAEEAVAARVNSDPVTAAQNNMQTPPTEIPASTTELPPAEIPAAPTTELPAAEIPAVAAPGLSIGGTVPMTPGENIAGVNTTTGKVEFMSNDRELYTKDDTGNLRVDPSTIRQEDQKAQVAPSEPQRMEMTNQPMQRKPEQPMPVTTPDPNFVDTMSSGSMASSPSQLRALNRAKLYGDNSGNLVNGHFS